MCVYSYTWSAKKGHWMPWSCPLWVLGPKLWSSVGAANVLNHLGHFSSPYKYILTRKSPLSESYSMGKGSKSSKNAFWNDTAKRGPSSHVLLRAGWVHFQSAIQRQKRRLRWEEPRSNQRTEVIMPWAWLLRCPRFQMPFSTHTEVFRLRF